ncbi:MAG: hypothetical protein ACK4L4_07700 [Gemmobacter sp.]
MKDLDPALLSLLQARRGLIARLLFWVIPKDRTTGDPVPVGFTSSVTPMEVTIGAETRTYEAAGGLFRSAPIRAGAGLQVRMHTVSLAGITPEAELILRGYDPRLAPAELHRLVLDPETMAPAGPPQLLFRGWVDKVKMPTPEKGGAARVELTLASASRDLTRRLSLKKSDESQRLRDPDDRFRRWVDVSGEVDVFWGSHRHRPVTAPPATAQPGDGNDETAGWAQR